MPFDGKCQNLQRIFLVTFFIFTKVWSVRTKITNTQTDTQNISNSQILADWLKKIKGVFKIYIYKNTFDIIMLMSLVFCQCSYINSQPSRHNRSWPTPLRSDLVNRPPTHPLSAIGRQSAAVSSSSAASTYNDDDKRRTLKEIMKLMVIQHYSDHLYHVRYRVRYHVHWTVTNQQNMPNDPSCSQVVRSWTRQRIADHWLMSVLTVLLPPTGQWHFLTDR